jgi:gliding motility-associated-like protein
MRSPLSSMFIRYSFLCITICLCFAGRTQQAYNNCVNALEICANQSFSLTNIDAGATVCLGCEDDFNYCFTAQNSIWMSFTTNAVGGAVQVDFSNLIFALNAGQDTELQATIIQALAPCDASTYTQIGSCVSNAIGNFSLNAAGLAPLTQYYIVVDGDDNGVGITEPAECNFDVVISGVGIDRLIPTVTISPKDAIACLYDVLTFTAALTDCPDNGDFEWYVNGTLAATSTLAFFQSSALQNGDIVTVQTSCYLLCAEIVSDATNALTINSFPLDAGPDQVIESGESVILGGSTTAAVYTWTPTQTISDPNSLNPIANPLQTTTYTLTATQGGCTLSDQVTITISSELEIPNTFSPNGDGLNETWIITGMGDSPNAMITIYTRWGQQVFETIGYNEVKAWDGTSKRGGKLAAGVYYYVIELRDPLDQIFKGSLTLIR